MKYRHKDIDGSRKEFSVEISHRKLQERFEDFYKSIARTAQVPGFRKGNVPRGLLERHYKELAHKDVIGTLIRDSYARTVKESNTTPVGLPVISDIKLAEGRGLSYKATVDIRPRIDLKNYKKIKIKKKKADVKEKEVDEYISMVLETYARFETVEDRGARIGDYLICDVVCEADGKPIYKKKKNVSISMDKAHTLPELVEGLMGSSRGDVKEIEAVLPENNEEPRYSRKKALFKIWVNDLKEKRIPEANDEFVKQLAPYNNLEEFRESVRRELMKKKEEGIKADMNSQVLDYLLKNTPFSPPKGLVEEETEMLIKEVKEKLRRRSLPEEEVEKKSGELRSGLRAEAERRVRLFFLLDEVARIEDIDVTDKEVDDATARFARQFDTAKGRVKEDCIKNGLTASIKGRLREDKVIEFLLSQANIKEE